MTGLLDDPLQPDGIAGFARRLRAGETSAEAAAAGYLARQEALEGRLGAFEHMVGTNVLAVARALDMLLAGGTDLGPLMGVPVAVKDLIAVNGMPTTAGSEADVRDIVGPEGRFVQRLKRAGCVIVGKTRTTEFALGASNHFRGTPLNPWSGAEPLGPGGSSSGSAVAVAAGLAGFAIGSDTGGSVRIPAAMCGTFGLKTTYGLWPLDGVFPLAPSFDSLGLLTASAEDAAVAFAALEGIEAPAPMPPRGLRLGMPRHPFFEELAPEVEAAVSAALKALLAAGVDIVPMAIPEAEEINERFVLVSPTELLAVLGRERFAAIRNRMDPNVARRLEAGLEVDAATYLQLMARRQALVAAFVARFEGLDGIVMPTLPVLPVPQSRFTDFAYEMEFHRLVSRNVRIANTLGLCGISVPIQQLGSPLPVGLQIIAPAMEERRLLAIGRTIEAVVGRAPRPDVTAFAAGS